MSTPTPAAPDTPPTEPAPAAEPTQVAPLPAPPPNPPAAPAASAQPPAPEEETDWEAEVSKWKSLARSHERKHLSALGFTSKDEIEELRTAAQKYREVEDAQKSEIQRANERAQGVEQELADLRSTNARLLAAAAHNIPADLLDLLGSGSDEEIASRAELLAQRLKAAAPQPPAAAPGGAQRPVESLTPGAAPPGTEPASTDDWLRRMAGRTP